MKFQKTFFDGKMTVTVEGRMDTTSSPRLDEALGDLAGVTELVLDLGGVEYISSSGLRVLLRASKIMKNQGSMEIRNISDLVREIFEITGFIDIMTVR